MTTHVFGIRHHGPGSARSLRQALDALDPDCLLIEGPPDAEPVLPLALANDLQPPVALLVYRPEAPSQSLFYPFATFSPEWQAILYGLGYGIPVRFMDLPCAFQLAPGGARRPPNAAESAPEEPEEPEREPIDPLVALAEAAGYTEHELWWEHQIEQRRDAVGLFEAVLEAMAAIRAQAPPEDWRGQRREAYMRTTLRAAIKEGFQRIAVVCGAWHAPALAELGPAAADRALLKGLPKVKVAATWVPWTYSRLSYRSGYGAGIDSPGWYEHLFESPEGASVRWATRAARLLRERDIEASPQGAIDAVRLADALAGLRELASPGLSELREAIQAVLCRGQWAPLALIRDHLEVGERLGVVPADTPAVPLQRDLTAEQKRLRMPVQAAEKLLDLDLREEGGRGRSRLLHRLVLLDIPWGTLLEGSGRTGIGTFRERWSVAWRPELAVAVIEASVWGNTLEEAAAAYVADRSVKASLPELTELLLQALPAELEAGVAALLERVQAVAALASDVHTLMAALPPLAQVARYGDVRGTRLERVRDVLRGLFERVAVGLPGACASLDDAAAGRVVEGMGGTQEALRLFDEADLRDDWRAALDDLRRRPVVHGRVRGRACRLLLELHALDEEDLLTEARLALAPTVDPAGAAAWIEGLVSGSGLLLVHRESVWTALDEWLRGLRPEQFVEVLPLVRRGFAEFNEGERDVMGRKVRSLGGGERPLAAAAPALDEARAAAVLPVLAHILGVPGEEGA